MRRHKHRRVLGVLRQGEELLTTECVCYLVLGTHIIILPQTTQDREKLVWIFEVFTELPSTRVGVSDFRSRVTFRGNQRCPEGDQHVHFTLDALCCLG